MALELVAGPLLSALLDATFKKLASGEILDYFRGRKLNEKLLDKLNIMLHSINALVGDAEQKQIGDPDVRAWLDAVKDAVLEAEDLLDEIDIQVYKRKLEVESQTRTSKVRNFFNSSVSSFDKEIESSVQQVLDILEYLASQRDMLGLKRTSGFGVRSGGQVSSKLPSTSVTGKTDICGRDDDKKIIFNCLMSDIENQLSIISIVGMGGMGKTTLAQHLYNDSRMDIFHIKAWICVSDEFDVYEVTKAILKAIPGSTDCSGDLNTLHNKLKKMLSGRKFLLVLDDIWNEDREKWEALQTPLKYGAKGSKILVTTRNEKVASIMQSTETHQLKQLQGELCWQLFAKHAFQDEDPQINPDFKEIGRKITKKCQGLPLALKTIGRLLHTKSSLQEWKRILASEIWNLPGEDTNIIPALMLSYHHLPSHLKRCFSYCSLFPKGYEFKKEHLLLLWMAENFLECPQKSMTMEEVGEQYFNDLLLRSFFQQSSRDEMCFVMHDLINDLAKYVSGDFCFRLEVGGAQNISKRTRHFSFLRSSFEDCAVPDEVYKATRLRTILTNSFLLGYSMHDLFSRFKFLRVLSVSGDSYVTEVPNSLGNLKHLRCLDLSNTQVKKLPDSTCLLYDLQILKLTDCLLLEELPNFLGNLNHLRYLDLSRTRVKKLPDSTCLLCNLQILQLTDCGYLEELPLELHELTNLRYLDFSGTKVREMPMHMGKLKNLQVLNPFYVGKGDESHMQLLGELSLHGEQSIREIQNIVNPLDALAVNLKNKIHLVKLELEWGGNHDDSQQEREVLEKLQPSKHLRELSIRNYGGTGFPDWFGDNSLINVVSLQLTNCESCVQLPPLGLLSSLKKLKIAGLHGIVVIGSEFYRNGSNSTSTIPFASLKTLSFINMEEWEEWECETLTGAAFPCLEELSIKNCPKLKGHLPEQLPCLKKLKVRDCQKLVASIPEHTLSDTSLERLEIQNCPNMNIFPTHHCYNFREVFISKSVDSLRTFSLDFFPKLHELILRDCSNLEMISQEHDHNLTHLTLIRCPKFVSLPECMHILLPSLNSMGIYDCPQLEFSSDGGFPPNLKRLYLQICSKLVASLKCVLGNTSLIDLTIGVDMESFPDHGLLPTSLDTLSISKCPNLKNLDSRGLCHLSSLSNLGLYECPRLQCLPEEGLPDSISKLIIQYCPLLKQRCQKPDGQDWGKISHIQRITIDGHRIREGDEISEGGEAEQLLCGSLRLRCLLGN